MKSPLWRLSGCCVFQAPQKKTTAMRGVTFISLVILLSLSESRILNKRDHHEGHHSKDHSHDHDHSHGHEHSHGHGHSHAKPTLIGDAYKLVGKETLKALAMIIFSQNLQLCPFEEQVGRVKEVTDVAEKCSTGIRHADCGKSVITTVLDEMCKTPENAIKYPAHAECCAKADPDRNSCFAAHKITDPQKLPPYMRPAAEQICKDYQDNKQSFMGHYIYEVSLRHPLMYAPATLGIAHHFEQLTAECCKDAATRDQCLAQKVPALMKQMKMVNAFQQHNCYVLKKFGQSVLEDIKLIQTSQKYPKASYAIAHDIAHDIGHLHKTCCSGDMMGCMQERLVLTTKSCNMKDEISSKLEACCAKDVVERSGCIVKMDNDDKPAGLSEQVREFIDDANVCQRFTDEKDGYVDLFAYEFSRRHPEFSTQLLLRAKQGYKNLLTKCCALENSHDCLQGGDDAKKQEVGASLKLLQERCGEFEKLGRYFFQNTLLFRYTKKMPQVTTPTLIGVTGAMTETVEGCCKGSQEKLMPCVEGALSVVVGEMCQIQETIFVNEQVAHCCNVSYGEQVSCFIGLGLDITYKPPALSADSFKFSGDLCTIKSPKELEVKKQTFLVSLIKLKPDITEDQLKPVIAAFLTMVDQCCKADTPGDCFNTEGPKMIEKCQDLLGVKAAVQIPA